MLVVVALLPPSFPPSATKAFYFIKRLPGQKNSVPSVQALLKYRGSPTYTKITNAVPYFSVFGLCTRKWGIFELIRDLQQSH